MVRISECRHDRESAATRTEVGYDPHTRRRADLSAAARRGPDGAHLHATFSAFARGRLWSSPVDPDGLQQQVQRHANGRPQFDDIALVCFGRVDPGAPTGSHLVPRLEE